MKKATKALDTANVVIMAIAGIACLIAANWGGALIGLAAFLLACRIRFIPEQESTRDHIEWAIKMSVACGATGIDEVRYYASEILGWLPGSSDDG